MKNKNDGQAKQPKEFSKKIFYIIITLFVIVIGYSMVLMWRTMDTTPLTYLIPSIGGLAATCVGFYYWKAKAENLLKIQKDNKMTNEEMEEFKNKLDEETTESEDYSL